LLLQAVWGNSQFGIRTVTHQRTLWDLSQGGKAVVKNSNGFFHLILGDI
jgi:hypothetical protein